MLHHLSFAVRDLARSAAFYDAALSALGYVRVWADPTAVGYGFPDGGDEFAIKLSPCDVVAPGRGFHVAFAAPSREAVARFHETALRHGGQDNGAPELCPEYGEHYYAAFVIDPDGYRIEAVINESDKQETVQIILRPATPADAPGVASVYLQSRKTFLPYAPLAHSDAEVRQWIADVLIPAGGVTVAATDTEIAGMMALSHDGRFGWIDQLYLHPSAVGRGTGSRLLEFAINELGLPIRLYTFQANTASRRFYERHGFKPVAFSEGRSNEERCPDVLYELSRTDDEPPPLETSRRPERGESVGLRVGEMC